MEIWTDHKNLKYFITAKKLNHCQACWSLHLARFNFLLHHRPGRTMGKPDALLRRADHGNRASNNENVVLFWLEFLMVHTLEEVELTGVEQKILSDMCKGNWNRDQEESITKTAWELRHSANRTVHSLEWSNIDGPTPVPRKDIYTSKSGPAQTDRSPLPRHPYHRSPQTMEDTRTGVPELLVASDV